MSNNNEHREALEWSFTGALSFLIAIVVLAFGGHFIYRTLAPANEAVRRETFENSKAFIDGNIGELRNYRLDYAKAVREGNVDQARLLRGTILQQHGKISREMLQKKDPSLAAFLAHLDAEFLANADPTFPEGLNSQ
jgi:hypothetical protein